MSHQSLETFVCEVGKLIGGGALGASITYFGKKAVSRNPAPPEIWVFPAPDDFNASPRGAGAGANGPLLEAWSRGIIVQLWGRDYLHVEQLLIAWVNAVRQVAQGASYKLLRGDHVDATHSQLGQAYQLMMQINTSIPRCTLPLAEGAKETDLVYPTVTPSYHGPDTTGETQFNLPNNPMVAGTG